MQRSLSRDTITIHFSALGKEEEEEEEELYGVAVGSMGATSRLDGPGGTKGPGVSGPENQGITTGLEASEELLFEPGGPETSPGAVVLPLYSTTLSAQPTAPHTHPHTHSSAVAFIPTSTHSYLSSTPPASSSWPSDRPSPPPMTTSSASSSPSRSSALSSSKPFLSLVRSLSNDVEAKESTSTTAFAAPPHARHRHLMKSFVKSLSTDTTKPEHQDTPLHHHHPPHHHQPTQPSQRPPPESRRNMQLFKQFSQPRLSTGTIVVTQAGGDSKTAPSSPLTSPDGRSFFKVQEVEARIEDTKRRLSEVMSDPLQLFSKIMGDESGTAGAAGMGSLGSATHRAKSLSSSASELSGVVAMNGHAESIKEEEGGEGEEEDETPTGESTDSVFFSFPSLGPAPALTRASSPPLPRSPSLALGRCSMLALVARQEDEDYCELYSEDFELCTDTETPDGDRPGSRPPHTGSTGLCSELDTEEEEEEAATESVPVTALVFLTQLVYCYLVLPVPPYICAVVQGVVAGFMLAILVLWLSAPRVPSSGLRRGRQKVDLWSMAQLDIKEPEIFKVRQN